MLPTVLKGDARGPDDQRQPPLIAILIRTRRNLYFAAEFPHPAAALDRKSVNALQRLCHWRANCSGSEHSLCDSMFSEDSSGSLYSFFPLQWPRERLFMSVPMVVTAIPD